MLFARHLSVLSALAMVATTSPALAQVVRSQNFDTDPGWTLVGSGANGNNFGYRTSANAGGSAGEAGGRFTRSTFVRTYADTSGISLSLDAVFAAQGRFNFTNDNAPDFGPALQVGHFSGSGLASVGVSFNNNNTGTLHWQASVRLDDGTNIISPPSIPLLSNVPRTWSYDWNPTGGTGSGRLTVTLSGINGGGTDIIDLTPAQRAVGVTLDGFGFNGESATSSNSGLLADIFIDDVTYSVIPVPEPSSVALMTVTVAFVGRRYRRRHSPAVA